jgi:hypothetical protein
MAKKNSRKKRSGKKFTLPLTEIEDYAKILDTDIFELLGLQNLPQEKKSEIGHRIGNIIIDRVLIRLDSLLSGPEIAELKFLTERNDKDGMVEFFQTRNIDIAKMMLEEAIALKAQLVNFVKWATKE